MTIGPNTSIQLFSDNISGDTEFHNTVKLTLKEVYETLKDSYGPYGSHLLIDNERQTEATKDGKTILGSISMSAPIPKAVIRAIYNVALKQVEEVGDGSTTTILLLCLLYSQFRNILAETKISPSSLQRRLEKISKNLSDKLADVSMSITKEDEEGNLYIDRDKLYSVVYTSVDGETPLADIITKLLIELNSTESMVNIKTSLNNDHHYELVKGVEIDGDIVNKDAYFPKTSRRTYENARVLLINGCLNMPAQHYLALADAFAKDKTPVVVLSNGVSDEISEMVNSMIRTDPERFVYFPIFRIKFGSSNNEFGDIAALLGANQINDEEIKKNWLTPAIDIDIINKHSGGAKKVMMTEVSARFADPHTDEEAIAARIETINEQIRALEEDENSLNDNIFNLRSRKLHMGKHYANLYVGGASEARKAINWELADDGVRQGLSSLKHGVIEGCNSVVPKIITDCLNDESAGIDDIDRKIYSAIRMSYLEMFKQLFINKYGESGSDEFDKNRDLIDNGHAVNIRDDGCSVAVLNSSYTDAAILKYSMDMASLLACTKRYIGLQGKNSFDIITKNYDISMN